MDLFDGARGDGVPVFYALCLVHNQHVGRKIVDGAQVARDGVVVGDFYFNLCAGLLLIVCIDGLKQRSALRQQATDDVRLVLGEALDLLLPLRLEGGRADDEHATRARMLNQQLGGSDGLNRFAESHLIAEQRTTDVGREPCALRLIVVERDAKQFSQSGACSAFGVAKTQGGHSFFAVSRGGNERQCVVVTA